MANAKSEVEKWYPGAVNQIQGTVVISGLTHIALKPIRYLLQRNAENTNDTGLQHMTAGIAALHCSGRCIEMVWAFRTGTARESAVQRTGRDEVCTDNACVIDIEQWTCFVKAQFEQM
jgi:hypothetical protein